jgi:hypothetical protein
MNDAQLTESREQIRTVLVARSCLTISKAAGTILDMTNFPTDDTLRQCAAFEVEMIEIATDTIRRELQLTKEGE